MLRALKAELGEFLFLLFLFRGFVFLALAFLNAY